MIMEIIQNILINKYWEIILSNISYHILENHHLHLLNKAITVFTQASCIDTSNAPDYHRCVFEPWP